MLTLIPVLLTAILTVPLAAQAQEPGKGSPAEGAGRLQQLLEQLRGLDANAWQQRREGLVARQKELEQRAAARRRQADELQKAAAQDDEQRKALAAEIEQLERLRSLVSQLPATTAAPKASLVAEAAATAQPAKAKPEPAAPAKAKPKVPAPKQDDAKSANPGKDAAKPAPPSKSAQPTQQPAIPAAAKQAEAKATAVTATAKPAKAKPEPAAQPTTDKGKTQNQTAASPVSYVTWKHVTTIFEDNCAGCHEPDNSKGGLDVTTFAAIRTGGGSGQSIVPGEPDQSRLYRMVTQQERPFMPQDDDPLPKEQLDTLRNWIEQGASEDEAAAKQFVRERAAALAKDQQAAASATEAGPAPMPEGLPLDWHPLPDDAPRTALRRSPQADLLAIGGDRQVALVGTELDLLGVLTVDHESVRRIAFSRDGRRVALGVGQAGRRGRAVVHDVRSGERIGEFGKERDLPQAVALAADLVAIGGSGKRTRVYSLTDSREILNGKHEDFVLGLAFGRDDKLIAAADRAGNIVVWDLARQAVEVTLRGHSGAVNAIAFDRAGKWLYSVGADGTLRSWDIDAGKQRWQQTVTRGSALSLGLAAEGSLCVGSSDGRIAVYSDSGKRLALSNPTGDWVYAVAFGADDSTVYACTADGIMHRHQRSGNQLSVVRPQVVIATQ
jgi:hypothetical protein